VLIGQGLLLGAIAGAIAIVGPDVGASLRHAYLVPALWAALAGGSFGGGTVGLVASLLQAPVALPAVERLGLTPQTVDGLISLGMPLAFGLAIGRLVDQARDRGERLRAVLEVQRALSRDAGLEESVHAVADRIKSTLRADHVGLVLASSTGDLLVAETPGPVSFDAASAAGWSLRTGCPVAAMDLTTDGRFAAVRTPGPSPVRGLTLLLDAGAGPFGVLAVARAGRMPASMRVAAEDIASHLALGVENLRLTLQQRHFAVELERKVAAATERLRDLDRAKTEFLSIVAHELRTPLTALHGFSELLLHRTVPPERAQRFLQHIHEEAARLGRIVSELLDLCRIETGRGIELTPVDVDLGELIERNIDLFAAEHRGHRFEWSGLAVPPLSADRDALDRMVKNLLSNAVKYSPHGGRVLVATGLAADRPGMVELSVEDDGVGIAAADLSRIFDRYVRVRHPDTASVRGLGLGLSMVQALAEAHGGTVEVESLPGKGSRFRVLLPGS
jgi:signal transduction histidine kinase